MIEKLNLVGQKSHRLTVIEECEPRIMPNGASIRQWGCSCTCGNYSVVGTGNLRTGKTKSCGCFYTESRTRTNRKHGLSGLPEYIIWKAMRRRCNNPNNGDYKYYGGRGISVCPRWGDFLAFITDMGPRPSSGHSIDRINVDGNYEPENCRWATADIQSQNRRNVIAGRAA